MRRLKISTIVAAIGVLAALWIAADPPELIPAAGADAVALSLATIVFLATGALPEHVTALFFFLIAVLLAVAPPEVVFAGFHATAFWLVFGGLIAGVGVRRTGLAERMATAIGRRFGNRYAAVIGGCVFIGGAMTFLMPSTMGRTLILMPIILAMADRLGYGEGSTGRMGMVLGMSFGTMLVGFTVMPATVPAVVLIGASEGMYGLTPVYGTWLLLHFPILGLLKAFAIWGVVVWMFPARDAEPSAAPPAAGPMQRQERLMAAFLVLALAFWVTDYVHHISPAWIALAVAAACVLPVFGVVPPQAFNENVNYASLFYLACILGVGALVAHSGVGDLLARAALEALRLNPGETVKSFTAVAGLSAISSLLLTQPSVPIVLTPLAQGIADASGMSLQAVLMIIVVGFSTLVLPYQAPPLIVAMQLGKVPIAKGNMLCLAILAVTVVVLLPLDYFWWYLLGWLG